MKSLIAILTTCLMLGCIADAAAQDKASVDPYTRYTKVPAGYLMVLRQGEDVLAALKAFAQKEQIPAANFTGMGFVNIKFGFFDAQTKKYNPGVFKDVELASMNGSIAWQSDTVSIHAHGVVTDSEFKAYGGHILEATVGTGSVEIMITVHDRRLQREFDRKLGANVLQVE